MGQKLAYVQSTLKKPIRPSPRHFDFLRPASAFAVMFLIKELLKQFFRWQVCNTSQLTNDILPMRCFHNDTSLWSYFYFVHKMKCSKEPFQIQGYLPRSIQKIVTVWQFRLVLHLKSCRFFWKVGLCIFAANQGKERGISICHIQSAFLAFFFLQLMASLNVLVPKTRNY